MLSVTGCLPLKEQAAQTLLKPVMVLLVPRIHLLRGMCEYLKTMKAVHCSVGVC